MAKAQSLDELPPHELDELSASALSTIACSDAHPPEVKRLSLNRAFHRAASNGDHDLLEFILCTPTTRQYIDIDGLLDETAAIISSCCFNHGDCVRLLAEAGCNVNITDTRAGWTALHFAVNASNLPLAAFLLNRGARIDIDSFKGLRPSDLAI